MIVELDARDPRPLYVQIADGLASRIERGDLYAGQRLPAIRTLASELDVALITVSQAYEILAARGQGYKGEILALVEDPFHRQPMILAGASGAYTPRHVLGAALAARASQKVSPTVSGIHHLGHKLQVAEARITRDSVLGGKTLGEAGLGQHAGVTVIGQWFGGKLISPPTPDMRLEAGGILVLLGNDDSIRDFMNLCAGTRRLRHHGPFLIAGSGEVGRKVAQLLTDCGEQTFMIDSHPGPGVNLVGNVLDTQILRQAGLDNA